MDDMWVHSTFVSKTTTIAPNDHLCFSHNMMSTIVFSKVTTYIAAFAKSTT
jgi:hypothetical protein